jgi:hypothetical protein
LIKNLYNQLNFIQLDFLRRLFSEHIDRLFQVYVKNQLKVFNHQLQEKKIYSHVLSKQDDILILAVSFSSFILKIIFMI